MTEKIIGTIEKYKMLYTGDCVTVALSGGADSVCLLLVLKSLEEKYSLCIDAIHINHCIRGDEADSDEEFCRKLCENLGVPFTVKRIDVPKIATERKQSLEETARSVRYEAFAEHTENGRLATAHTASDNAETVLFNLVRGTGLKGLCGIPPVRENIIRPLIDVTRDEVEEFLKSCGQGFVTDSTNLETEYSRNKIRHNIIPEILKINSGFYRTFASELKIFNEEDEFIRNMAKSAYKICYDNGALCGLDKFDAVIRKRCIALYFKENMLSMSAEKINSVNDILDKGGKINIKYGVYAVCRKNTLSIMRTPQKCGETTLCEGENSIFPERTFSVETKNDGGGLIDADKIKGELILRGRRNGDRIQLAGRDFTSSVKKLLNEKVRADLRPFTHFLSDDEGLVYIENIGVADRVKTSENTVRSIYIKVSQRKN